jgi:hypothetical protein
MNVVHPGPRCILRGEPDAMTQVDETVRYEEFLEARQEAIARTDRFTAARDDDPARAALWDSAVEQTHTAQALLERWLRRGELTDDQLTAADEVPAAT